MLKFVLFGICFLASLAGATVGMGGGSIIKPLVDMTGVLPVSSVSFYSSCAVLATSVTSLIRNRNNGELVNYKTSTGLAIGAVGGGLVGKSLFELMRNSFARENVLGAAQSVCVMGIAVVIFVYLQKRKTMISLHVTKIYVTVIIGVVLGMVAAFVGVGGGMFNVAVLLFFFSMDAKEAAKNSMYIIIFSQTTNIFTSVVTSSVPVFSWTNLIAMVAGSVAGAMVSAIISLRMKNRGIENLLKLLIIIIAAMAFYNLLQYTVFYS